MNRLRTLWAEWLRAVRLARRREPVHAPGGMTFVWFARRPRRLDARGLQGMLAANFGQRPAPPVAIEEPPRKAVGSSIL